MIGEIPTLPAYAVAYGLKGFGNRLKSLRVNVDRVEVIMCGAGLLIFETPGLRLCWIVHKSNGKRI